MIVAAPAARRLTAADWERFWLMTHVRFDGIAFGLLTALASDWKPAWVARLKPWARPVTVAWLLLFAGRCVGWPFGLDYLSLLNAATALVLASTAGARPLPGAATSWSRWAATLSYSIYLIHTKAYGLLSEVWSATPLQLLPAALKWPFIVSLTLVMALVLHSLVEKPGLALRARVRRRLAARAPQGPPQPDPHGPSSKL